MPGLAIGNAIGSNIANIGLVLGLTAIIFNIKTKNNLLTIDVIKPIYKSRFGLGIWLLIVTFIAALFLSNQVLSKLESIVLIFISILISIIVIKDAKNNLNLVAIDVEKL